MKAVALFADSKYSARMDLARKFLALVAMLCCAFGLAAPSAARSVHLIDHIEAPVAEGEVHSHDAADDHGKASVVNHDAPKDMNDVGKDKSGHSHMPGSVFDLGQPPLARSAPCRLVGAEAHAATDMTSLTTRAWTPPVRPPRTA